ncbi:hypothetical protein DUI37_28245, partial [Bacillus anthracis]
MPGRKGKGRGGEEGRIPGAPGPLKKKKKNAQACASNQIENEGGEQDTAQSAKRAPAPPHNAFQPAKQRNYITGLDYRRMERSHAQ